MNLFKNYLKKKLSPIIYTNVYQINSDDLFTKRNILLIGGATGIGYAIAQKIISSGGSVLITGRSIEKLQSAQTKLGNHCEILQWDITNIENGPYMLEKAINQIGGEIDCLINCAAVWNDQINFSTCTEKDWDSMMNTNLKGIYFITNVYANRLLKKNRAGNILMISSERGLYPDDRPYGLSKAALNNYVQALSRRLVNHNIRVNALAPGWTATEHAYPLGDNNLYTNCTCSNRMMIPEEVAEVACFIISDAASCISGAIIPCNLGNHIRSDW